MLAGLPGEVLIRMVPYPSAKSFPDMVYVGDKVPYNSVCILYSSFIGMSVFKFCLMPERFWKL